MKVPMMIPLLLLTFITGVYTMPTRDIYVKAGDMVALHCQECNHNDTVVFWKKTTNETTYLSSNMSAVEQRQLGVVLYENYLVILSASSNHQGNYSCYDHRKSRNYSLFKLIVCTVQSKECEEKMQYPTPCYTQESCTLICPKVNIPTGNSPIIKANDPSWHKNGEPSVNYFSMTELKDSGNYSCTWSYLYSGQKYNVSFTVVLEVRTEKPVKNLGISLPHDGQVFPVQLGTTVVITCIAITDSCFDSELFWLKGDDFVADDVKSRVFNNLTCNDMTGQIVASLVFTTVLEEDLSKNFTCKLQNGDKPDFALITLTKIACPSYIPVIVCSVIIVVVMAVVVVVYKKFKVDVTLFLRDALCCQSNTSDGKTFDAFVMCYNSDTNEGLNEDDRRWLENTLEEQFNYKLCLYDRDVLPGKAVAEAVLESVEQSRAVVLVPCCQDTGPGTGLLSAIHAALVERKTRLIFINTEQTEGLESAALPEALQLLHESGESITWTGRSPPPSSFWKQLRYHLPAPRRGQKHTLQLSPQTCYEVPLL